MPRKELVVELLNFDHENFHSVKIEAETKGLCLVNSVESKLLVSVELLLAFDEKSSVKIPRSFVEEAYAAVVKFYRYNSGEVVDQCRDLLEEKIFKARKNGLRNP